MDPLTGNDAKKDGYSDPSENIQISDTQTQIQNNPDEAQVLMPNMGEARAVSTSSNRDEILDVKTVSAKHSLDDSKLKSVNSGEEDTSYSPSKSIVEVGIETKVDEENIVVDNVVQKNESFEEVEETYDEEIEEDGEVKVISKTRLIKVKVGAREKDRSEDKTLEDGLEEDKNVDQIEGGVEEEYEEEETGEDGEVKVVKKTRVVKVLQTDDSRMQSVVSYVEKVEEYEEEEVDENGESVVVKKTRMIRTPKEKILSASAHKSFDEVSKKSDESKEIFDFGDKVSAESDLSAVEKKSDVSELSIKVLDEVQIDSKDKIEEVDDKSSTITMSSEEQRIEAEKAEILQQFDVLMRLRGDHIFLRRKNFSLNNKLVLYFKKQKMEYVFAETREDQDVENKFYKKLETFFEHNKETMEEKVAINAEWESQKQVNDELSSAVKEAREKMFEKKREVGSKMVDFRSGRTIIQHKAVEDLVGRQELILRHLSECSLSIIKLKRKIEDKRRERQMQHVGSDFSLMNYEKLASLKDYYTDKITERDVEINEVREKLVAMDENLSSARNRLKRAEDELQTEQLRLQAVSAELLMKRANLNHVKATRHRTEKNTARVKQQSGLLAYPILLKDYEHKSRQLKEVAAHLELLKQHYKNGIVKIRNLRGNIKKRTAIKYSGLTGKYSPTSESQ